MEVDDCIFEGNKNHEGIDFIWREFFGKIGFEGAIFIRDKLL